MARLMGGLFWEKKGERVKPLPYYINKERFSLKNIMGYEEEEENGEEE